MGNDIGIKESDIREAFNKINNAIKLIEDVQVKLEKNNNNLESVWEGESKQKYYKEYKKIANKYSDYITSVRAMRDDLNVIVNVFNQADDELKRQFLGN